jgi:hypothetical protein
LRILSSLTRPLFWGTSSTHHLLWREASLRHHAADSSHIHLELGQFDVRVSQFLHTQDKSTNSTNVSFIFGEADLNWGTTMLKWETTEAC